MYYTHFTHYSMRTTLQQFKLQSSILLCLVLLACQPSEGTSPVVEMSSAEIIDLVPFESRGMWGYCNASGDIEIPAEYVLARPFYDSIAVVTAADGDVLISVDNTAVSEKYERIERTDAGFIATRAGSYEILNSSGDVIKKDLDSAATLPQGHFRFWKDTSTGVIHTDGSLAVQGEYEDVLVLGFGIVAAQQKGSWYAFKNERQINESGWEFVGPFQGAYAGFNRNGKVGLLDSNAVVIADAAYDEVRFFVDGVAVVGKGGKYGAINTRGDLQVAIEFDELGNSNQGVMPYRNNGKFGYVRTNGERLFDGEFEAGSPFYGYNAIVWNAEKKAGLVNNAGTPVCEFEYDNILMLDFGLFRVQKGLQFWLMDSVGTLLTQEPCSKIAPFNMGLALAERNEQWNLLKRDGTFLFPTWYDNIKPLDNGYFLIEKDNKWGVMNPELEWTVPNEFASIGAFRGGYTWCRENNKFGILHQDRGVVLPPTYEELGSFENGTAYFMQNNMMGVIDSTGTVVVPAKYHYAGRLKGTNLYSVSTSRKFGVLSEKGAVVVPVIMDRIEVLPNGALQCSKGDRTIYYSQTGTAFTDHPVDSGTD